MMKGWEWGLGLGLVTGLGAVMGVMLIKRRREEEEVPDEGDPRWVEVGSLHQLLLYPVKSGQYENLQEGDCTPLGLTVIPTPGRLTLGDRFLVVFRGDDGDMLTSRTHPKMLRLQVRAEGPRSFVLSHPILPSLTVTVPSQPNIKPIRMWRKEPVENYDCGEEAADWITRIIRGRQPEDKDKFKYRLGCWLQDTHPRGIAHHKSYSVTFKDISNRDGGTYTDLTSFMLMTKSSMDDFNAKLEGKSIPVEQFRPNFLIDNKGKPFEEDDWKWIRIGDTALFKTVKPCDRCILTLVDPETCVRDPRGEPLKTLKKYRMKEHFAGPLMGVHLGLYKRGAVKLGDGVKVILK